MVFDGCHVAHGDRLGEFQPHGCVTGLAILIALLYLYVCLGNGRFYRGCGGDAK